MDDINKSIQEKHAERKLNILKGFSDLDETFEKAVYKDNAENQKLQRVGKEYGGSGKDDTTSGGKKPKQDADEATRGMNKTSLANRTMSESELSAHAKDVESDQLKTFIEKFSGDNSKKSEVAAAKKELESRGDEDSDTGMTADEEKGYKENYKGNPNSDSKKDDKGKVEIAGDDKGDKKPKIGNGVTFKKLGVAGGKAKGKIIDIDKDGKYLSVRTSLGNIDYISAKDIISNDVETENKTADNFEIDYSNPEEVKKFLKENEDIKQQFLDAVSEDVLSSPKQILQDLISKKNTHSKIDAAQKALDDLKKDTNHSDSKDDIDEAEDKSLDDIYYDKRQKLVTSVEENKKFMRDVNEELIRRGVTTITTKDLDEASRLVLDSMEISQMEKQYQKVQKKD